jgi:hypothetical protein
MVELMIVATVPSMYVPIAILLSNWQGRDSDAVKYAAGVRSENKMHQLGVGKIHWPKKLNDKRRPVSLSLSKTRAQRPAHHASTGSA